MRPSNEKLVFLACAADDFKEREALEGHRLAGPPAYRYVSQPLASPGSARWRSEAREMIERADGVIVLVSRHTDGAASVQWQIGCAKEAGKRILAVRVRTDEAGPAPALDGQPVVDWDWDEIAGFVAGL